MTRRKDAEETGPEQKRDRNTDEISMAEKLMGEGDARTLMRILEREAKGNSLPDEADIKAMEETVSRIWEGTVLFDDMMSNMDSGELSNWRGLIYLAVQMRRHAEHLYRFYHGHEPRF